ncbi:hypothetical protein [Chryseobacterium balustinum]|uniref:DUF1641 domain-containing protein n=1 Tax=Chryseobacterium balustinum TaxID=246 RepID=A0AAX2ILJ8_9FLAO|nr:hypothetical protein [Chryseobacterium balustinum]AZB29717.1 hypothetical protein EB354_10885 [Chryseobacterium balustinum]SKB91633.1 hypothetical protein SAMN05421800_11428 [Chryseobacterium balustinum]SQA90078.1 Uncharacterised protein [Chryseobacterium balustinum]
MKIKPDKLITKLGNTLHVAKNELLDKKNDLENEVQKSVSKVKNSTTSLSRNIEDNTKKIGSAISNSFGLEQVILEFLKNVNLDKMISAIKDLEVVDKKTISTIDILLNVLILLRDNKDGNGVGQAISLLKDVNISDMIETLRPFLNLIPYGSQLIFVLKFIVKISKSDIVILEKDPLSLTTQSEQYMNMRNIKVLET